MQKKLPAIKTNFNKNNDTINSNYNIYNNSNHKMEINNSNENLPMINNNSGNNSNNNSFQNYQINKINNNYLSSQFYDLEAHEEENFKQIDMLMKKIMND